MMESYSDLPTGKTIARVAVDRLFGDRTYLIPHSETDSKRVENLILLYGDNGSGKTTLLRMVYSLLSPASGGGFKTFLAKTPFASFSVSLADGTTFAAVRAGRELVGGFELILKDSNGQAHRISLRANSDNAIKVEGEEEHEYLNFLSRVRELGIALYYLSDDRRLQRLHVPETIGGEDEEIEIRYSRLIHESLHRRIRSERMADRDPKGLSLEPSIDAFVAWARRHALRASNVGEGNTNTIYADLIRRITSAYQPKSAGDGKGESSLLRNRLLNIEERSKSFVELGLISRPPVEDLVSEISRADERSLPIVSSVLSPYVEGLEARLNALQELRNVLTTFVENLNDLYSSKRVSFTLGQGLRLQTVQGMDLRPELLSSGEKQLLVLLCNTLMARDQTSIFVIDEPELSLNVKWQRKLVKTLLEGVAGSAVQFILATHSIELLSAYHENVTKLENNEWDSLNAQQLVS